MSKHSEFGHRLGHKRKRVQPASVIVWLPQPQESTAANGFSNAIPSFMPKRLLQERHERRAQRDGLLAKHSAQQMGVIKRETPQQTQNQPVGLRLSDTECDMSTCVCVCVYTFGLGAV